MTDSIDSFQLRDSLSISLFCLAHCSFFKQTISISAHGDPRNLKLMKKYQKKNIKIKRKKILFHFFKFLQSTLFI